MRQGTKGAMCRGVAVATNHGHAGQRPTLLGANNMHDALTHVRHRVIVDTEFLGVGVQSGHLHTAVLGHGRGIGAVQRGRHVMIRHRDGLFGRAHLAARHPQPLKGLRAGHFVDQMAVDIQQASAVIGLMDNVIVPDLVVKCARSHGSSLLELAVMEENDRRVRFMRTTHQSRARTDRSKAVNRHGRRS